MKNIHITINLSFITLIGNIVAAVLSYHAWHSIAWMILHAFLGWFYVAYFIFMR